MDYWEGYRTSPNSSRRHSYFTSQDKVTAANRQYNAVLNCVASISRQGRGSVWVDDLLRSTAKRFPSFGGPDLTGAVQNTSSSWTKNIATPTSHDGHQPNASIQDPLGWYIQSLKSRLMSMQEDMSNEIPTFLDATSCMLAKTKSSNSTQIGACEWLSIDPRDEFRVNLSELNMKVPTLESPFRLELLVERWQYFLVFVYSLTAITSLLLNALTVIVLSRYNRSELRKYLMNLSMSDLLMSFFSIQYMLGRWIFPAFMCPLVRFVDPNPFAIQISAGSKVTLSVFVSVATMTVIGVNRHLAIMYPLKQKRDSRFKRLILRKSHMIGLIWLAGIAISLPEYLMFSAEPFCYNSQLYFDCRSLVAESVASSYAIFIFLSTFVVPLSLLSYLYTAIGLKLWRRRMPGNSDKNRDLTMQSKRAKAFTVLMILYPDLRQIEYKSTQYNIFVGTYFASHWLGMAHSCLNPLIYCFMNDKFRSDLHDLICSSRTHQLQQQPQSFHLHFFQQQPHNPQDSEGEPNDSAQASVGHNTCKMPIKFIAHRDGRRIPAESVNIHYSSAVATSADKLVGGTSKSTAAKQPRVETVDEEDEEEEESEPLDNNNNNNNNNKCTSFRKDSGQWISTNHLGETQAKSSPVAAADV